MPEKKNKGNDICCYLLYQYSNGTKKKNVIYSII